MLNFLDNAGFWDFLAKVQIQSIDDIQNHPTYVLLKRVAIEGEHAQVGVEADAICLGEDDLEMLITPPAKIYFLDNRRILVFDGINEIFGCMLKISEEIQENVTRYTSFVRDLYSIAHKAIQYMQMVVSDCELIDQFEKLKMV